MAASEKNEETLALFRAIVNSSHDVIVAGTPDGAMTIWNASAERLYGYTAKEAIGQSLWLLAPPDRRDETVALLARIKRGERIETFDTVRRRKDGSLVDVSLTSSPIQDSSGRTIGFSDIVRDITERKRAEEAVARVKREWERTFDSMPDLITILDVSYQIVRVNRPMAVRLGWTPEQCVGRTCFEGVHGRTSPPDFCPHTLTLADGKEHSAEVHEERLGGDFLVTTTPIIDEQGQILGSVHVARDITERKKVRESLEKEHRTLKHLLQSSDHERQLIAYEIHDGLAQQLAGAIMQFETCSYLRDAKPDDAARAYEAGLTMLRQGHLEARRLISGVRSPVLDESGLVAAVAQLVSEQRLQKGPRIELRSEVEFDRLVPILENAIYRIVQEGLANACRHSHSQRVRVELMQHDDVLQIKIQDWGEGFDPARVEADRFGLEGIRQRARLLGGSVSVESTPGQGTCLAVELPLALKG
jgi:PAS domain S-box-containing protein